MFALVIKQTVNMKENRNPLVPVEMPDPVPAKGEILVRVSVCGICHTELDEIEGRTPPPKLPVVPGHQIVGRVERLGDGVKIFSPGERVGIAWIFSACGECEYCRRGDENLCRKFIATGRDVDGGYAELVAVPENFAFRIPETIPDRLAAPMLCAGAIGYRSLALTGLHDGQNLGLTGFGASGHLVLKMARNLFPHSRIYVFARRKEEQAFAWELGVAWSGDTTETPPAELHAIIDTTPAWKPVVEAMRCLAPGGRLVINAIRKESADREYLQSLDYPRHLWMEKEIKSVTNVTRRDVAAFLDIADRFQLVPDVTVYPFYNANDALHDLKERPARGAKVLLIGGTTHGS